MLKYDKIAFVSIYVEIDKVVPFLKNNSEQSTKFIPYIPASKSLPELTITAILLGIILAVIFGAANAYLGLLIGMTISASIPASVISMGILRGIFRRDSILENNIVQTMTTSGEAIGVGAVFTLPALFLLHIKISYIMIFSIVLLGGFLGILMMVPLRRLLIVQEHGVLPYPEGTACAEVLKTGEEGGKKALLVLFGLITGGLVKVLEDGFNIFKYEIQTGISHFKYAVVGLDAYPSLLGVGFIIGPSISGQMLAGGLFAWIVLAPLIGFFGADSLHAIFPAVTALKAMDTAAIWDNYIRYIGAGAVAAGGIITLIKTLPTLYRSLSDTLSGLFKTTDKHADDLIARTDRDLSMRWVILGSLFLLLLVALNPFVKVGWMGAVLVAVCGFLFVTVSSRIVGIVGSSSSPVSGMTIATLLIVTIIYKFIGYSGTAGIFISIGTVAIICTALAVSNDISQDLKTGFLVGATPWKQQVAMMIGVVFSSITIGAVLFLLNSAYHFGSHALPAPKAVLMKLIAQGLMQQQMPWELIFIGAAIAVCVEFMGINSLVFAVGLYLPIHISTPIMCGGIVRYFIDRFSKDDQIRKNRQERGTLMASGLIAGESLIGVVIAVFTVLNITAPATPFFSSDLVTLIVFAVLCLILWYVARGPKKGV